MQCVVEGHTISEEEWSDDSWQSPGYRAQERRRLELQNQGKLDLQLSASDNARAAVPERQHQIKPRPPPLRRRAPLPRLPQDTIHIAYLRVKSINVGTDTIELHVYAPPPDDAVRGIMFHAYDDFSDNEILADLQASNPDMPIVSGRRMGQTRHIVVALTTKNLPKWIFYHGTDIRLYPFYNSRVEACFNCRKVGHRMDVCPLPRKQRCRRCGEEHPPPGEGEKPKCTSRCIVCCGAHNTGSSNCKYRFVKKAPPTPQLKQEAQEPTSNTRGNPSHSGTSSSRSPSPRDHSPSFPPPGTSSSQHKAQSAGPDPRPGA
ncbi:hypothetical protein HPB52_010218 [Rhipicephalus sanguineus]|uniref:CCHC-type domain-containing protein n=1 Tax=Rhipicephalus sanguineus TaxID=34632 RepID=A0A9D4T9A8_RHISA|nr:hypothetical protein HPB52_010218 [Rhipicephalus sanguineus]